MTDLNITQHETDWKVAYLPSYMSAAKAPEDEFVSLIRGASLLVDPLFPDVNRYLIGQLLIWDNEQQKWIKS